MRMGVLAPSFKEITNHHLSAALGGGQSLCTDKDPYNWNKAGNEMLRELRGKVPFWKKILASFNPYSWLATR